MEHLHFLSHPKANLIRSLERTILELRQHMSISALANYFQLRRVFARWYKAADKTEIPEIKDNAQDNQKQNRWYCNLLDI